MKKPDIDKFKQNLKRQVEENPILAIGVFAATATAVSKLVNANSERRRVETWKRETARREYQTYHGKKRR